MANPHPDDEEDPRMAHTFMSPDDLDGEGSAGDVADGEEDPRMAHTFMAQDELEGEVVDGEEDPRMANTFMSPEDDPGEATQGPAAGQRYTGVYDGTSTRVDQAAPRRFQPRGGLEQTSVDDSAEPDLTFMAGTPNDATNYSEQEDLDESAPDLTFMDQGPARPSQASLEDSAPEMTFMDAGGGGSESAPDMTFMDAGGSESAPDMTFMDPSGGSEQLPDMTFMDAGHGGTGNLATMNEPTGGQSQSRAEATLPGEPPSDVTFVSMASQEGMVSSPSLSSSASRSQTALRTQRFEGKEALNVEDEGLFAGKYKLLGELARGGMGVVYKALHVDLNQIVALKLMLAGAHASDEHRRRFLFEAEACARLKHPNIVPVFDVGTVGDNLYFTMAFVKGHELKRRQEAMTREQLLDTMIKVTDSISYAHQRGIIHRDLKPANVMMTEGDEPLVMDFGLAKQVGEGEKEDEALEESELAKTTEGAIMGTPYYMSPEQAQGLTHEIDTRTDTYALGVILYQLWTKKLPFTAKRATEILRKIVTEEPLRPRAVDPTVDADMEAIILKAMDKVADRRYESAAALKEDLLRYKRGDAVSAQRATFSYRFKKWARRNYQQLLVAALIFVVVSGSIGALAYQRYTEQARREAAVAETITAARSGLDALGEPIAAVKADLKAFFAASSGSLEERAKTRSGLRQRVVDLIQAVDLAQRPLGPYIESHRAAEQTQGAARELRAELVAGRERIAALERVHGALAKGSELAAALRKSQPAALAALSSATQVAAPDFPDLAAGIKASRALLAKANQPSQTTSLGADLDAQREDFAVRCGQLQGNVYAGQAEAPVHSPEAQRARALLAAADELLRQLDAARDQVRDRRLAQRLLSASRSLLGLLDVPQPPPREVRGQHMEAARLAQSLIHRGLEAARGPELSSTLLDANAAYARALLAMQAYRVFDVALAEEDALRAKVKAELSESKLQQLAARDKLRQKLLDTGGLSLDLMAGNIKFRQASQKTGFKINILKRRITELAKLGDHPLLDDELDEMRRSNLEKKQEQMEKLIKIREEEQRAEKEPKPEEPKPAEPKPADTKTPAPKPPARKPAGPKQDAAPE